MNGIRANLVRVLQTAVHVLVVFPTIGRAGDGAVALQSADPSCRDDSGNIYVDCGNGTVTDNRTGLVWLADATCLRANWRDAIDIVAGLSDLPTVLTAVFGAEDCGLTDGSVAGEWRLPTAPELLEMFADGVTLGCNPAVTNDPGDACWNIACSFVGFCSIDGLGGLSGGGFWSATNQYNLQPPPFSSHSAAFLVRVAGWLDTRSKSSEVWVWPVRGGQ